MVKDSANVTQVPLLAYKWLVLFPHWCINHGYLSPRAHDR